MEALELNKLHQGVTYEQYAAQEGLRSSTLKLMKITPAHYQASLKEPKKKNKALEFGKAVHGFIEEGDDFRSKYLVEPEFWGYTQKGEKSNNCKESKELKANWYANLPNDVTILNQKDHDHLIGVLTSIGKHKKLKDMLQGGMKETSGWVKDPETGLILKFRPDFISRHQFLIDFKTSVDVRYRYFKNQIFKDGRMNQFYILQVAHYCYCAKLMGLERPDIFHLVAMEKKAPYGIMVHSLDKSMIDLGEAWRSHLTRLYAECVAKNEWPCYPDEANEMFCDPEYFDFPPASKEEQEAS